MLISYFRGLSEAEQHTIVAEGTAGATMVRLVFSLPFPCLSCPSFLAIFCAGEIEKYVVSQVGAVDYSTNPAGQITVEFSSAVPTEHKKHQIFMGKCGSNRFSCSLFAISDRYLCKFQAFLRPVQETEQEVAFF